VVPPSSTTYVVLVTDENGCQDTATARVELYPPATVYAGLDMVIDWYDEVQLNATGNGIFTWTPPDWLDCTTCSSPVASPDSSIAYTVMVTDTNGCMATDQVLVIVNGSLFVPNAFTPDGDGYNDGFGAWGRDIKELELLVFNRWGELIWSTTKLNDRWDGTYQGVASPIDTYVWKVEATEISGRKRNAIGHVTLVR
ncbi:MAG TPA: T9SS type B sorting domain-containing protein, partial [Flavobacteriales bacterium]|nr:T9SS type B sorting domain-containing protein [Flavobacteriales bacterium]